MRYDIFGKKKTFILGELKQKKILTPDKVYEIQIAEQLYTSDKIPILLTEDKAEIFYLNLIFNSYIINEEENVYVLFSVDNKTTIIKKDKPLLQNMIYTFKIIDENEDIRICEVYKNDEAFVGRKLNATVKHKGVVTELGKGTIVFQNFHSINDNIDVILYKLDEKFHYLEIGNQITGKLECTIDKEAENYYLVKSEHIKGILYKNRCTRILNLNEKIILKIDKERDGKYILSMINYIKEYPFDLEEGMVVEAKIKNVYEHGTFVIVNGFEGRMKIAETSSKFVKNWQELLKDKKTVRGMIYEVDKKKKRFEFSVKKYENMVKMEDLENGLEVSVPFEIINDVEIDENDVPTTISNKRTSNILDEERKRSKVKCEEDFLMEIKANPKSAIPLIKYASFKLEHGDKDESKSILYKNLNILEKEEKDKLSIAYINILFYLKEHDIEQEIKKLAKLCSESFLSTVIESHLSQIPDNMSYSGVKGILNFYFSKFNSPKNFELYLRFLFNNEDEEAWNYIKKHKEYLEISIELIYMLKPKEARTRVENIVGSSKDGWIKYLKLEDSNLEYVRGLYNRVVEMEWKVAEVKEFYRMWLDFEKRKGGDEEKVKTKAKNYVLSLKDS